MCIERLYVGFAVLGAAIPLSAFLPWLAQYGINVSLFVQEMFASRISAFFAWDVIISALVVLVAVVVRRNTLSGAQQTGVIAGTLLVGVSLGLPLLLLFEERARPLGASPSHPQSAQEA
jgi:hypothetical protein